MYVGIHGRPEEIIPPLTTTYRLSGMNSTLQLSSKYDPFYACAPFPVDAPVPRTGASLPTVMLICRAT